MPRNVAYRRTYSDFTCASQAFAANATMYILRQTGPTGFLLKEEGEPKDFKMGLSDMELDGVMRGPVRARPAQQRQPSVPRQVADASGGRSLVPQRDIADDDVCPICQDEFMDKKLPVTYCKFGCGNNVHIKCMKVWAEHQLSTSQDHTIKCPMCREDFGPITLLKQEMRNASGLTNTTSEAAPSNPNRMDRHVGLGCSNCRMAPIEGKCYRCCSCADFYLCQACFNTPAHTHHSFQFRHKRNQRWRNAQRMLGAALPDAIVNDLLNRELSASDYDTLLQLDSSPSSTAPLSDLTEETIQMLPVERVREGGALLAPGAQCRVCLRSFKSGQYVRKLPCQHKFHKDCIDGWLLHSRPTCPVDSLPVFTNRPHSDTGNRNMNRQIEASSGSQASRLVSSSGREEVRSLSVPALGISAIRINQQEQNGDRGDRGVLARRPPRDPHIPHRPPARLELTGTRVGADDVNAREELPSDMLVPGGQLLQQAMRRRSQVNHQLTRLMLESNVLSAASVLDYSPPQSGAAVDSLVSPGDQSVASVQSQPGRSHFPFHEASVQQRGVGNGGGGAVPDRARQRRPPNLRSKAPLRQRSGSRERTGPSSVQDLYLGNDPRINPPPEGDVVAAQVNGRGPMHNRLSAAIRKRASAARGNPRIPNMTLEGNSVLDQLTLRDLL